MAAGSRALFRAALSRGSRRSTRPLSSATSSASSRDYGTPRCTPVTTGSQQQLQECGRPCVSLLPPHSAAGVRLGRISASSLNALPQGSASAVRSFAASSGGLPDHLVLEMPSLSPTMTQGNVVEWNKKEGDEVSAGDSLCVIETDKATLDNESQEDGFLAKILVPGGSKEVPCGTPICIMVDTADAVSKFSDYSVADAGKAPAASSPAQPEASTSPDSEVMPPPPSSSSPPLSHLMGPAVKRLLERHGLDPHRITPTGPKGILTKGDVLQAIAAGTGGRQKEAPAAAPAQEKTAPPPATDKASFPATPSKPSMPPTTAAAPSSEGSYVDIPNTQIRKVIATRLLESKWQTPHFYSSAEAHVDSLLALRKSLKEKYSISVSVNDFVVKAVAMALKEVPRANAFFDVPTGDVKMNGSVDVCVAVATDRGLMTPIVKNADKKSLSDLSSEVKSLAERARAGKLKPEEFMGGTFSISNLGMYPVDHFCAIINPPQAGILAIGRGNKVVIWKDDPAGGVGGPATVTSMEVTLSGDARVMDGTVAGLFLTAVTKNLSDPTRLII
eukprot:TRINITY_DN863_c0_g1_i1.p1 TRINITY_DN863_c0_g1~~TRINITY_DN863_c0_g1_i1.p1  ORF type:complete len:579 (+),score=97.04 TRINITY_DN863_c0_g1_i1:62-1738(+)